VEALKYDYEVSPDVYEDAKEELRENERPSKDRPPSSLSACERDGASAIWLYCAGSYREHRTFGEQRLRMN
jgi:hypothetical protein